MARKPMHYFILNFSRSWVLYQTVSPVLWLWSGEAALKFQATFCITCDGINFWNLQADIFMMQNWEHILVLMGAINKPPRDIHKISTDLTRVRLWSLEGHAPLYRQTLIFSSTPIDYHRALISKCTNFAGKLEVCGNTYSYFKVKNVGCCFKILSPEFFLMIFVGAEPIPGRVSGGGGGAYKFGYQQDLRCEGSRRTFPPLHHWVAASPPLRAAKSHTDLHPRLLWLCEAAEASQRRRWYQHCLHQWIHGFGKMSPN